ncbi:MAG: RnfABCDGE type electron transport complex subunit D [Planctomycetota bacterium]|nr:RnfABCDGE type electron transport complex subunit D [Planctomycetota bacterium]
MTEEAKELQQITPVLSVAPGPHISAARSMRRVMIDVLIALVPAAATGIYVFGWRAGMQMGVCVVSCMFFEALFQKLRKRPQTVGDLSAAVTGLILALSIPWTAPWYVGFIGSAVAILIAKMLFGGLGSNIFNPAMAGRAFLQACFAGQMTTYLLPGDVGPARAVEIVSQATPLAAGKFEQVAFSLQDLALGCVNGSVGETGAIACLIGGMYLILRRSASWRIPLSMLAAAAVVAGINQVLTDTVLTVGHHLLAGGLMFGAFFIATDPATSPLSRRGRWIFGAGTGVLVMLIRLFANVPEGVMYAVLVMNMTVPLIDRWTVPRPVGGRVKK